MNQIVEEVRVGKRYALYLPRSVVKALGIREGDKLTLTVEGDAIVLRKSKSFFEIALEIKKVLRLSPEEIERISLEAQEEMLGESNED
ncbi:MAG: hypothetical protein DRN15_10660 [Thermoprotei archaeon]|nr:MAG: hypothetical protein DRN15_10660 [Thermoprotei archaeon]RLF21761.1 MAG: hypothetical protein DRM97_06330 [Thermoprotei archaeon]